MRAAVVAIVLLALTLSTCPTSARRKGEENWKQRYKSWKASDEQAQQRSAGALIGTDEAAAAKLYREEQNSVYDTPSEDELWRQRIEEKKRQQGIQRVPEVKPVSEITAWHEEKLRRKQEHHLQVAPFEPRQKRRHPRESNRGGPEQSLVRSDPPPHTKVAEMARYIVHNSDWAAVAYISHQPGTFGLPMADVFSISDGLKNTSTGIPYMYLTPKDGGVQDLSKDSRCSLAMSLAQGDYCRRESLDPEDPRCAHVFLTGKIKTLKNGTEEWAQAEKFFFDRHPKLQNMPKDHKFRFAKLKISHILVQDYFGGPAQPTLAEYFAAKPEVVNYVQVQPTAEVEAELLPGASVPTSDVWRNPIE